MQQTPDLPISLSTYPKTGSFAALLKWHLRWGTYPRCSVEHSNKQWTNSDFATLVHDGSATKATAEKNLRLWKSGRLPDEKNDANRIESIFSHLFGDDPNLEGWKADLRNALNRERVDQAARIARLTIYEPFFVPPPVKPFIGRDSDIRSILDLFNSTASPPTIFVRGGPGNGKTELTKAVAYSDYFVSRFGNRRWFASLESATTSLSVQESIARAVGCNPKYGLSAALESVAGQDALLILDNFETPWEAAENKSSIEHLLAQIQGTQGLCLLISMRGSHIINVPAENHFINELGKADAESLFCRIAGKWVTKDPMFQSFIEVLGGCPLAISLTARRAFGRNDLGPLWQQWLKIKTKFPKDLIEPESRTTYLYASIELSLNATSIGGDRNASILLRFLGFLYSGISEHDRDVLIGDGGFDAEDKLIRSGLCNKYRDRLSLLPVVREHVSLYHCIEDIELEELIDHYLSQASGFARSIGTRRDAGHFVKIRQECRNLEAIILSAFKRHGPDALYRTRDAISILSQSNLISPASLWEIRDLFSAAEDPFGLIFIFYHLGMVYSLNTDIYNAKSCFFEVIKISRQHPHEFWEVLAIDEISRIYFGERLYEDAMDYAVYSAKIFSSLKYHLSANDDQERMSIDLHDEDRPFVACCEAFAKMRIGDIHIYGYREYSLAQAAYEEAKSIFDEFDNRFGAVDCSWRLAGIIFEKNATDAFDAYQLCLAESKDLGYLQGEAQAAMGIGNVAVFGVDYSNAVIAYSHAIAKARECKARALEADALLALARTNVNLSLFDEAYSTFIECIAAARAAGSLEVEAQSLLQAGDILQFKGDLSEAEALIKDALQKFREVKSVSGESLCMYFLGAIAKKRGDFDLAKSLIGEAANIFEATQNQSGVEQCQRILAAIKEEGF